MLSILCVRLTIKVKVGIPESFKVGWYPLKKTGSSHLKSSVKRTIFFAPVIVKYMEKNFDITKPRYSERILSVPWPFVLSRLYSALFCSPILAADFIDRSSHFRK